LWSKEVQLPCKNKDSILTESKWNSDPVTDPGTMGGLKRVINRIRFPSHTRQMFLLLPPLSSIDWLPRQRIQTWSSTLLDNKLKVSRNLSKTKFYIILLIFKKITNFKNFTEKILLFAMQIVGELFAYFYRHTGSYKSQAQACIPVVRGPSLLPSLPPGMWIRIRIKIFLLDLNPDLCLKWGFGNRRQNSTK